MPAPSPGSRGRLAVWLLLAVFIGLTIWWVRPAPAPAAAVYQASMAVPSEWVEQARVTSPDGKLDAVIVHADPTEALQTAPAEGPSKLVPVEGKGETESRVLSVRVVPKGAKTERARPFPFPTSQFMDRLAEQSAFVSSYTPEVKVSWADDSTLLIQSGPARVVHQAQEITLADGAASRRVSVTYSPATPTN